MLNPKLCSQAEELARWSVEGGKRLPPPAQLRRSSQYFTLTRRHSALAANESAVEPLFAAACTDDQAHNFRCGGLTCRGVRCGRCARDAGRMSNSWEDRAKYFV